MGELYAITIAAICLDDIDSGNWRWLLVGTAFPIVIVLFLGLKFLKESTRYLLTNGKYDRGFEIMDEIGRKYVILGFF